MSAPASYINPNANYKQQPNKAYQSTRAFATGGGALFSYSTSLNGSYQTVGTLTLNPSNSAANCPVNRVLHANGKVLIPGVNPGGGSGSGAVTPVDGSAATTPNPLPFPLIGVYDPVSGLNGYINPQNSTWAVYDATMPANYDSGLSSVTSTLGGQGAEPRFANTFFGSSSGNSAAATVNISSSHTGVITVPGTSVTALTVTSAEVTTSSIVLLTLQSPAPTASLAISTISNGSFIIRPSAALTAGGGDLIHYIIVN
jgi:hypothetical protein